MNVGDLTSVSSKNREDGILLFASVQVHVEEREKSHSGLLLTSDGVAKHPTVTHPAEASNRIILTIRNENCLRSTPANKRVEF